MVFSIIFIQDFNIEVRISIMYDLSNKPAYDDYSNGDRSKNI